MSEWFYKSGELSCVCVCVCVDENFVVVHIGGALASGGGTIDSLVKKDRHIFLCYFRIQLGGYSGWCRGICMIE